MKEKIVSGSKTNDLIRFYTALDHLESGVGGKRLLSCCDGKMDWPERGVYFFFENGESRSRSGNGPRAVRVGTHALTSSPGTTLWSRLYQHRGVARTGGGNHRGSVFRKLVGQALIAHHPECAIGTWGKGSSAPSDVCAAEFELEQAVSSIIGEMPFLWLEVDDPPGPRSRRGYIERNAIALLSAVTTGCVSTRPQTIGSGFIVRARKSAARVYGTRNTLKMITTPGFCRNLRIWSPGRSKKEADSE